MTETKTAARAECQGCHYRFPKPDMKSVIIEVGGGYVPSRTTTRLDKNGYLPTGYSKSQGYYRQGRTKTVWYCKECFEKREADIKAFQNKMLKGCVFFLGLGALIYMVASVIHILKSLIS